MTVRPLRESDIPALRAMAEASGFPYPADQTNIESTLVVSDDKDRPVMACAAERIVQLYLYVGELSAAEKLHAIRLLHDAMAPALRVKGYTEANCFIPPQIALCFGRRLVKMFGWIPNWPSWFRRI